MNVTLMKCKKLFEQNVTYNCLNYNDKMLDIVLITLQSKAVFGRNGVRSDPILKLNVPMLLSGLI